MEQDKKIIGLLFVNENGISKEVLCKSAGIKKGDLEEVLNNLKVTLNDMGLTIIETPKKIMMSTSEELTDYILEFKNRDFKEDIGRGAKETLSIIMYLGPVTKTDIDFIRGVNTQSILNQLFVRGFIEKDSKDNDKRAVLYQPTLNLLSYLGVSSVKELSNYQEVRDKLSNALKSLRDRYDEEGF